MFNHSEKFSLERLDVSPSTNCVILNFLVLCLNFVIVRVSTNLVAETDDGAKLSIYFSTLFLNWHSTGKFIFTMQTDKFEGLIVVYYNGIK